MSTCARCGAEFFCGAKEGDGESCWCMNLPPLDLAKSEESATCLCPACLQRALEDMERTKHPRA